MRLGILGGSFDPVHLGHLILADIARETLALDRVLLVPAAISPLKPTGPRASDADRCAMLELAIADDEGLEICDAELQRGGRSYTIDTLRQIRSTHPTSDLRLVMGADQLQSLDRWRDFDEICELAIPAVVARAGFAEPDLGELAQWMSPERLAEARQSRLQMPQIELSSTELRERIGRGQSIRFRTPRAVEQYIAEHGLYRE